MFKLFLIINLFFASSILISDKHTVKLGQLNCVVHASRDTQVWQKVVQEAKQNMQAIQENSMKDVVGSLIEFCKTIWYSSVPEEIEFSGSISYSTNDLSLSSTAVAEQQLPNNTLVIIFEVRGVDLPCAELSEHLSKLVAEAVHVSSLRRSTNSTLCPLDLIDAEIQKIRQLIHDNPKYLTEAISIWLKTDDDSKNEDTE